MSRLQIGVAVGVPEPYRSQLHDWRERLGDAGARAIPPHVTLLPPTGLAVEDLDAVRVHLEAIAAAHPPFRLELAGSATFRPVSPVVFVQLRQGMAECALLEREVRQGPLQRDTAFPYYPHVTVAHELTDAELDVAEAELAGYTAAFDVSGICLFERAEDGCWRPMQSFPLTGTP